MSSRVMCMAAIAGVTALTVFAAASCGESDGEEGEHDAMEVHFVHVDEEGSLAVVGVLMDAEDDTASPFGDLFAKLPSREGATGKITEAFDLTPEQRSCPMTVTSTGTSTSTKAR